MATAKSSAAKSARGKASSAKPAAGKAGSRKAAAKDRHRRSPAQLLADLKAERDGVAEKMGARLAKLDERIQRVEARYDTQIRLAELTSTASVDDLQRQLEEAKRQQKLLRLALKTKK